MKIGYIGRVGVNIRSGGGEILLHRIFEQEPRLVFIGEIDTALKSELAASVTAIEYNRVSTFYERFRRSRFSGWAYALQTILPSPRIYSLVKNCRKQNCSIIVTIAHGPDWASTIRYAGKMGMKTILIVHDLMFPKLPKSLVNVCDTIHENGFRAADCRLVISAGMDDYIKEVASVDSTVMLPNSAKGATYLRPKALKSSGKVVVGYGGNINSGKLLDDLCRLGRELNRAGMMLKVWSRLNPSAQAAFVSAGVEIHPFVDSNIFAEELNKAADVALLMQPFEASCRVEIESCFPSKMAEYVRTGLPVFVVGPDYASAVKWSELNLNNDLYSFVDDPVEWVDKIIRITANAEAYENAVMVTQESGEKSFSFAVAQNKWNSVCEDLFNSQDVNQSFR